jgi:hypothetical protein
LAKQDEVAMLGKAEKQVNVEGIALEGDSYREWENPATSAGMSSRSLGILGINERRGLLSNCVADHPEDWS